MEWMISNAIVVDDAFGPPPKGSVDVEDKNSWIDYISDHIVAQEVLVDMFTELGSKDLDEVLITLTSEPQYITRLWDCYENAVLAEANLQMLFRGYRLHQQDKVQKALTVYETLMSLVGTDNVKKFWRMEDATQAMSNADVAFIDFFMNDNEPLDDALSRIRRNKDYLQKPKLLFFMSSIADVEMQQKVRDIVGKRTAFFGVVSKSDIDEDWVVAAVKEKSSSYLGNKSLEELTEALLEAAQGAAEEFKEQFDSVEMHDLRLLDLSRLAEEGERISSYLTWLASEAIAAKIRRLCAKTIRNTDVSPGEIGFTGQINQSRVLFDLFSEVVFGPAHEVNDPVHFGEVFIPQLKRKTAWKVPIKGYGRKVPSLSNCQFGRLSNRKSLSLKITRGGKFACNLAGSTHTHEQNYPWPQKTRPYLLVLTPACDLVRCEMSTQVLCVLGVAQEKSDIKAQTLEKLYGKHETKVRHLLKPEGRSPELITWQKGQTVMLPVWRLQKEFQRVAQMNEFYAQEVKEEVLREIGRIGTQIDPPPSFALQATLRWKIQDNGNWQVERTGKGRFYAALITYSEQSRKQSSTVILSDEFKKWAITIISESLNAHPPHIKLSNGMKTLKDSRQFILKKGGVFTSSEFALKFVEDLTAGSSPENSVWIDITLSP